MHLAADLTQLEDKSTRRKLSRGASGEYLPASHMAAPPADKAATPPLPKTTTPGEKPLVSEQVEISVPEPAQAAEVGTGGREGFHACMHKTVTTAQCERIPGWNTRDCGSCIHKTVPRRVRK